MPHLNSSSGDDHGSADEVKVYNDEGEEEEQRKSSENLIEDKVGLVNEGEQNKTDGDYSSKNGSVSVPKVPFSDPRFGYLFNPYPSYGNGATHPGFGTRVPLVPTAPSPFTFMPLYVNEAFSQPPPAHLGIPPVPDPKTGLPRPPMYAIPTPPPGQFPTHPLYGTDFSQWSAAAGYASPIRSPYSPAAGPTLLPPPPHSAGVLGRFSPSSILSGGAPHPSSGMSHASLIPNLSSAPLNSVIPASRQSDSGGKCSQSHNGLSGGGAGPSHRHLNDTPLLGQVGQSSDLCGEPSSSNGSRDHEKQKKSVHIKKPLNAFMLFMKEMRSSVVAECTLKESAAINQILGRKWHALSKEEQAKYYEMAKKEKELHLQLYPGWTARDNYACHSKRKKKRKNSTEAGADGSRDLTNPKKCRARFGLEHQNQWCKPCRRKKKCIRFLSDNEDGDIDYAASPDSPCGPQSPSSIDHCTLPIHRSSSGGSGDEIKSETHTNMVGVKLETVASSDGIRVQKHESPPSESSSPPPPSSSLNSPQKGSGGGAVVSSQTAYEWSSTRSAVADSTLCESPKSPTQSHQALMSTHTSGGVGGNSGVSSGPGASSTGELLGLTSGSCGGGHGVGASSSGGSGSGGGQETDSGVEDVMCSSV